MLIAILFSFLPTAHAADRYVICEGLLVSPRPTFVRKASVTEVFDNAQTTFPVYKSADPDADLIVLVTAEDWPGHLPAALIQNLRITGVFPGQNAHEGMDSTWITADDLDSVGREFKLSAVDQADLRKRLRAPSEVPPDNVDSVTYVGNVGAAFENLWTEPGLRFVRFTEKEHYIYHRASTIMLGQRATRWSPADWMSRPLDLLAADEQITSGRALPPSALTRIAAIYVDASPTRRSGASSTSSSPTRKTSLQ